MNPRAILFLVLAGIFAGCSANEAGSSTNDSDFTSERAEASADLPVFTEADAPNEYGARVRSSFAGGEFRETETTASRGPKAEDARSWALGVATSPAGRSTYAYFGAAGTKRFEIGTYSCADGDARIFEAEWNADGTAKPARHASTCSVTIDKIVAGPSSSYARAYGRFEATANAPDGLASDVRGTFLADFPIFE